MKKSVRLGMILVTVMMLLMLSACKSGEKRYELTNYIGKSVATFEKRSGTELTQQSNGVYSMEDVVQVMAPDEKVSSITLLKNADKYTVYGVGIGMDKEAVETLLADPFGKEVSKTKNEDKNIITYAYLKDEKQLYVSYNTEDIVTGLSFYKISANDDKDETLQYLDGSGQIMIMIDDCRVYYNEAMVYLKSVKDIYESDYGAGIWGADILGNGESFGKLIKDEVVKQITELKIIRAQATKQGIALTEEEQAEADAYAKEYYEGLTKEDIDRYFITEELMKQVYSDNLLAEKMFESLTINVDTNVTDEEAKQITVQDIFIQNYNLDSSGKKIPLSEEDKNTAYEKITSLLEQAKTTEDFKALAETHTEAESVEYTFGKGEGPKGFGEGFEDAALALKTGEISDIITTDTGWHIIFCVSDFNEDATTQVKENIIDERENSMFSDLYSQWVTNYNVVVNEEAWNSISLTE